MKKNLDLLLLLLTDSRMLDALPPDCTIIRLLCRQCKQIWLEMEIGITGGEEDGVDNTGADQNKLYTQPKQVLVGTTPYYVLVRFL